MGQNKSSINWALLIPLGLLLLEAIAVMVMITSGYEISQVLFFFLIFLAIFLVYQIFRQLSTQWRVKHATSQLTQAQALIDSDKPLEAITLLKEALFSLAESDYLTALNLMNDTYASYFPPDRRPARTCVGVTGLARGALVEIDMVARRT